ncbi:hypothetical protein EZV62_003579 [Acer yangbiense]|uniref:Uncharacterized protein n=1 Tax=Acer yangbiense TaxID=1000413 RepID=A0A5C7II40_9ROSI|nr:hypothetical protein EZV62_003579 [Acer yangbiense]
MEEEEEFLTYEALAQKKRKALSSTLLNLYERRGRSKGLKNKIRPKIRRMLGEACSCTFERAVQSNRNAKTIVFYYHYQTSTTVDHLYRGLLLPSSPSQWRERAKITIVKGVGELVWAWGSELCPFLLASEGCLLTTLSRHIEGLIEGRYFWTMMHGNVVPETSIVKSPSAEVISVLKLYAVILRTQCLLLAEEEDIL